MYIIFNNKDLKIHNNYKSLKILFLHNLFFNII